MKKFVVIDGNAILHRAWHALPPTLMTDEGVIVNAAYGFTSILLKVIQDLKPAYLIVAWDTAADTFRDEVYEDYKGQRETKEQELYDQVPIIQDIMDAFGIPNIFLDGYEADDVIGTLVENVKTNKNVESIIVTGDLDSLQLVDETTRVYTMKRGISDIKIYDVAAVQERYSLRPDQIIDMKSLKGDSSDNIPGVKGIGEKTAISLLHYYDTLDALYEDLDTMTEKPEHLKPAQFRNLKAGKDDAFLAQELVTIMRDVPIEYEFEDAAFGAFDLNKVVEIFHELGFKSLLNRIPDASIEAADTMNLPKALQNKEKEDVSEDDFEMTKGYRYITTEKDCEDYVEKLSKAKIFAFDTETSGVHAISDEMLGMSISYKDGEAVYIATDAITESLKKIFADKSIEKIAHQAKFDIKFARGEKIEVANLVFDTKIAAFLVHSSSRDTGLKDLAFAELGVKMKKLSDLTGTGKSALSMKELSEQKPLQLANYACADADMTFQLYKVLKKQLKEEELEKVFSDIELPLINVLVDMEMNGVVVDPKTMQGLSKDFEKRLAVLEKNIYKAATRPFNINSPSQLGEILYDELSLPTEGIKKTKKGFSTAASELDKLRELHPIINLITQYRELFKLKSTYIDNIPELIAPETGRIHGTFNQIGAATGRLSSTDPNLQNIPIRTEEGRKIRQAFVAPKGYKLMSVDYSQFELRIVASLAGDKGMIESFKKGEDIHKRTAARIFGLDINKVTKDQRYAAKAVNFGIIYGQGPWGLSQTADIPMADAKVFIEKYFQEHKDIKNFLEKTKEEARKNEYVETAFGRKRYLPEINSGVAVVRSGAERMAINMPVQGTQADILKMTMAELDREIKKKYAIDEVKMILTVHDEVVFEVKNDLVEEVAAFARKIMEKPKGLTLKVPIKVDVEVGQNWGDMKEMVEQGALL